MTETSPDDSTSLGNDGTGSGMANTTGQVSGAQDFTGSGYVDITGVANDMPGTDMTLSCLFKTTDPDGGSGGHTLVGINKDLVDIRMRPLIGGAKAGAGELAVIELSETSAVEADSGTRVDDGAWHLLSYTRDGATGIVYIDGVAKATHTADFALTSSDLWYMGQVYYFYGASQRRAVGQMDEVRISNTPRSADWLAACAKMMKSNSDFLDYGDVTSVPVAGSTFFGW
jgi:hypothetical protein